MFWYVALRRNWVFNVTEISFYPDETFKWNRILYSKGISSFSDLICQWSWCTNLHVNYLWLLLVASSVRFSYFPLKRAGNDVQSHIYIYLTHHTRSEWSRPIIHRTKLNWRYIQIVQVFAKTGFRTSHLNSKKMTKMSRSVKSFIYKLKKKKPNRENDCMSELWWCYVIKSKSI